MRKTNCCGADLCYDFSNLQNGDRVWSKVDQKEGIVEIRDYCDGSGREFQLLFVVCDDGTEDCCYPHQLTKIQL